MESRVDMAWKMVVIVGILAVLVREYGSMVTPHGIGGFGWNQAAAASVCVASAVSVVHRYMGPLIWGIALLPVASVVCFTATVFFLFLFGGPARSDLISARVLDACDRVLALFPSH